MSDTRATPPELILALEATPPARDLLAAALKTSPPACVIVAPSGGLPDPDEIGRSPPLSATCDHDIAKALIADCQAADVAGLIAEDVELAKALGADGVHLTCSKELAARQQNARKTLGPAAIVGILSDRTRHTAMVAGEAGADYLAFDLRPEADPEGLDHLAWWVEIFEVPAVALIGFDSNRARNAKAAGADFLALIPPLDGTVSTPALLDAIHSIMSAPG